MNGTFMYASEIKALLQHPPTSSKELNTDALKPYMTFQYPAIPETFFKGVFQAARGALLHLPGRPMDIRRYYDEPTTEGGMGLKELVDTIDRTVVRLGQEPIRSPTWRSARFLSSGVDSSYVAAVGPPRAHLFDRLRQGHLQRVAAGAGTGADHRSEQHLRGAGRGRGLRELPPHPVASGRTGFQPVLRAAVLPVRTGQP